LLRVYAKTSDVVECKVSCKFCLADIILFWMGLNRVELNGVLKPFDDTRVHAVWCQQSFLKQLLKQLEVAQSSCFLFFCFQEQFFFSQIFQFLFLFSFLIFDFSVSSNSKMFLACILCIKYYTFYLSSFKNLSFIS
jgi:hypothetical protein